MDKVTMRDWVCSLEAMVDKKLAKWDKHKKWENGKLPIHLMWQWEPTIIKLDIFWKDGKEVIRLKFFSPMEDHDFMWIGLSDETFNGIQDRIGNLAMRIMHPPIDPTIS